MNNISFESTLTNFKLIRKGEDVYWQMQLKVMEDTSIRMIPQQFRNDIDFNGAIDNNATRDAWTSMGIPVADYNLTYQMNFSELEIEAKLVNIAVSRKEGNDGIWRTEYVFSFNCDPDKDTIKALALYVKRKETDPESGKKYVATYHTELSEPKIVV
jgi:hypothetical protein